MIGTTAPAFEMDVGPVGTIGDPVIQQDIRLRKAEASRDEDRREEEGLKPEEEWLHWIRRAPT